MAVADWKGNELETEGGDGKALTEGGTGADKAPLSQSREPDWYVVN